MKSFYTKIYWYLIYGRFKGRWLRIQYQILQIQNGGSNIVRNPDPDRKKNS